MFSIVILPVLSFIFSDLYVSILYSALPSNLNIKVLVKSFSFIGCFSSIIKVPLVSFNVSNVVINPIPVPPSSLCVVAGYNPNFNNVFGSNSIPVSDIRSSYILSFSSITVTILLNLF